MSTLTKEEIQEILRKHRLWLDEKEGGERAYLTGAYLIGADLTGADLRNAYLTGADLRSANLYRADLSSANLYRANLRSADLSGANLSGANLRSANLYRADLSSADLRSANLYRAYLSSADLSSADLSSADLRSANLRSADLRSANLYRADLSSADLRSACLSSADLRSANLSNTIEIPGIACPEKGSFIGFKKAGGKIVELLVLEDSLRSSATTRKCRCSKAKVLSITNLDGSDAGIKAVQSGRTANFVYSVGETVEVPDFETDRWKECAPGIHFFITRQEAVEY